MRKIKLIYRILLLAALGSAVTGCHHYMALNEKDPDKYVEYWDDDRKVKEHILYGWSDNCKENNDSGCR